ncbi:MAG: response regulator [Planctomycetales bacterium]|nr:response regulator [Planctomycetales bacterium]
MAEPLILLVEDDEDTVELARRALRGCGLPLRLAVARDGAEALALLLDAAPGAERPRVVVLDLRLPKLDGFEVLRRLRGEPSSRLLPVVVLTSSRDEGDIARAYALGANSYVRKPVEAERFREAMTLIARYWGSQNETPPPPGERAVPRASP